MGKKVKNLFFLNNLIREIKRIFFDRDVIILLLAAPIFLTLFFGGVYFNTYLEDIPIAVLDEDGSSMSRMIVQQFQENERFHVVNFVDSKEELKGILDQGKVNMGVYIPHDFGVKVTTLQSSEVLIIVDGSNVIIGNNAYAAAAGIIQTISAGTQIKLLQAKGMVPQIAEKTALAFQFNDRVLYDPRMKYINYLLYGFVAVFLQQVMLSGVGISVIKERQEIIKDKTFLRLTSIILACGFFALIATFISIGILVAFFKIPLRGSLLSALVMSILFIFAISPSAILLAALTKEKIKLAQISFMLSLPTFVSCGYVWPVDQMPKALVNGIKIFWPLINFARPFDELLMKGVPLEIFRGNILEMGLYTLFWMPMALWVLKRSIKKYA